MPKKILAVDDERHIVRLVEVNLQRAGYEVVTAYDGREALEKVESEKPDLVVLDVMMPYMDGFEVLKNLKANPATAEIPVIMLTAKTSAADKVAGLDTGADDYLAKPFEPEELLARIRAQLRRSAMAGDGLQRDKPVQVGDLRLEPASHEVWLRGEQVTLTRLEFNLLYCMAQRAGKVLTRDDILRLVWGENEAIDLRGIDAHIRRLRAKVEDDADDPKRILTVHGVGYKMATA